MIVYPDMLLLLCVFWKWCVLILGATLNDVFHKKHPKNKTSKMAHYFLVIFCNTMSFVVSRAGFQKAGEFLCFLTQYFDIISSGFLCSYPMYEISQVSK